MRHLLHSVCGLLLLVSVSHAETLTFQQGDGGAYSETDAAFISLDTHVNFGSANYLMVYAFDPDPAVVSFVRFPNIIGDGPGRIPVGSPITSATLELTYSINSSATTTVHAVRVPWDESTISGTTWGDVLGVDYILPAGSVPAGFLGTVGSADVTSAVQLWTSGYANQGFHLRPVPGTDREARFHSDDATVQTTRPKLIVEFERPIATEPSTWGKVKALYR